MNKAGLVLGAVIICAAIAGAAYTIAHNYHPVPVPSSNTEQDGTGNASVGATGASAIVSYTDKGFSPSPLPIAVGTTVTWVNQSSHQMWIETTGSSGGDCTNAQAKALLNECASVGGGGSYSYTFSALGTFSYFNQQHRNDTGTVIVTEASSSGRINPKAVPE